MRPDRRSLATILVLAGVLELVAPELLENHGNTLSSIRATIALGNDDLGDRGGKLTEFVDQRVVGFATHTVAQCTDV